jgi:tRNA modification GTPase
MVHAKADLEKEASPQSCDVSVSSLTGYGLPKLRRLIEERARMLLPREGELALNARHRGILADCVGILREALDAADPLIKAEALRMARLFLDRITGRAGVEEMLDELFGAFCIGK